MAKKPKSICRDRSLRRFGRLNVSNVLPALLTETLACSPLGSLLDRHTGVAVVESALTASRGIFKIYLRDDRERVLFVIFPDLFGLASLHLPLLSTLWLRSYPGRRREAPNKPRKLGL